MLLFAAILILLVCTRRTFFFFFFFNDTATTEIYTLSLHDALPISCCPVPLRQPCFRKALGPWTWHSRPPAPRSRMWLPTSSFPSMIQGDRKSTRLNSSHLVISYAVFCLKKKKTTYHSTHPCNCLAI